MVVFDGVFHMVTWYWVTSCPVRIHFVTGIVGVILQASEWSHEQQSIEANKRNDHLLDQYAASADWLAHFLLWNAGTLKSLPLTIE